MKSNFSSSFLLFSSLFICPSILVRLSSKSSKNTNYKIFYSKLASIPSCLANLSPAASYSSIVFIILSIQLYKPLGLSCLPKRSCHILIYINMYTWIPQRFPLSYTLAGSLWDYYDSRLNVFSHHIYSIYLLFWSPNFSQVMKNRSSTLHQDITSKTPRSNTVHRSRTTKTRLTAFDLHFHCVFLWFCFVLLFILF